MNENLRNSESLLQLTTLEMSQVERTSMYMSNLELSEKGQDDRIRHHSGHKYLLLHALQFSLPSMTLYKKVTHYLQTPSNHPLVSETS